MHKLINTRQTALSLTGGHTSAKAQKFEENKKYVLCNAAICSIASKVGHVTLATPPFGVIHHRLYLSLIHI